MASAWINCQGCKKTAYGDPGSNYCDKCLADSNAAPVYAIGAQIGMLPPGSIMPFVTMPAAPLPTLMWTDASADTSKSANARVLDLLEVAKKLFFTKRTADMSNKTYTIRFQNDGRTVSVEIGEL